MERTFNSNVSASAADILTDSISGMGTYNNFSERNSLLNVAEVIPISETMFSDFNIAQQTSNLEYSNASTDPSSQMFPTLSASSSHNKYSMNEPPLSSHHQSHQLHSSNDPCAHVVHVLLCYHQGGEDLDFIRKAIESLVKKLKDRRMELDALISAVTSGGKQPSGCVTIHRSLDGRLQVAGRKGVPHVVYARIWRWPNVNKNELQKLPICATANDHPDLICINPFHYERVVSSGIGSLEISPLRMDHSSLVYDTNVGSCEPIGGTMPGDYAQQNFNHFKDQSSNSNIEFKSTGVDHATFSASLSDGICGGGIGAEKLPFLMFGPNQQPSCVVSHLASGNTISNRQLPGFSQQQQDQAAFHHHHQDPHQQQCHMPSSPTSKQAVNYTSQLLAEATALVEESRDGTTPKHAQYWPTYMDNNKMAQKSDSYSCGQGNNCDNNEGGRKQVQNTFGVQRYNNLRYNLDQVRIPFIMPPEHWCTIVYYELDTQVGEAFKVPRGLTEVVVDGGLNPSAGRSGRFCLGALSNVHRTEASEKARIHIGKGVKLKTTADGSVYLQCMSHKGVFVRSYFLDFEHSLIYGSTVHKFCSGAEKKLFDLRWAFAEMCEQRESAQMAVVAQAYAVAGIVQRVAPSLIERAGIGVDDLRRVCCTIAISFVKGWGSGYNRSSIKETPCWIEIHLHRPLQLLNFLLQKTEQ